MAGRIEGPQEAMEELASAGAERVPHSILLEQQVLGAMMLNHQAVEVVSMLTRTRFTVAAFARVRCVRACEADQPADLPLVIQNDTEGELAEAAWSMWPTSRPASVHTNVNTHSSFELAVDGYDRAFQRTDQLRVRYHGDNLRQPREVRKRPVQAGGKPLAGGILPYRTDHAPDV